MKLYRFFLLSILLATTALAQQGGVFNYVKLLPSTLPSSCNSGDMRVKSGTTVLSVCGGLQPTPSWQSLIYSPSNFTADGVLYALSGSSVLSTAAGTATQILTSNGPGVAPTFQAVPATGVTSVGLLDGSTVAIYSISGSPVTSTGTLTFSTKNQSANTVFSGPSSGSATNPTFRTLVGADLPNPSSSTLGGIQSYANVSNQWINTISTSGVPSSSQPAFSNLSGSASLTSQVTGILPVANGGTNSNIALNNNRFIVSSGGTIGEMGPQGANNVLGTDTNGLPKALGAKLPIANGGTNSSITLNNNRFIVSSGGTIGEYNPIGTNQIVGTDSNGLPLAIANPLPIANGGTNSNIALNNSRVIVSSGGTLAELNSTGASGKVLTSNGPNLLPTWQASASTPLNSNCWYDTGNGYGVVNTKVRIYTTVRQSCSSDITYATNANNGDSWTINSTGTYAITVEDSASVNCQVGISVNGSALTTAISSVTYAQGSRGYAFVTTGTETSYSVTIPLTATDVVRSQGDGACNDATTLERFIITRVN